MRIEKYSAAAIVCVLCLTLPRHDDLAPGRVIAKVAAATRQRRACPTGMTTSHGAAGPGPRPEPPRAPPQPEPLAMSVATHPARPAMSPEEYRRRRARGDFGCLVSRQYLELDRLMQEASRSAIKRYEAETLEQEYFRAHIARGLR